MVYFCAVLHSAVSSYDRQFLFIEITVVLPIVTRLLSIVTEVIPTVKGVILIVTGYISIMTELIRVFDRDGVDYDFDGRT